VVFTGSPYARVCVVFGIQHSLRNAPYFQLWPLRLYNILPHYFINGTI